MEEEKLTFGQEAVGLTFNLSGDARVNKVKMLMSEAIDILEGAHNESTDDGKVMTSWTKNVFRTAVFNAIIAAQMALVKYLTWSK